MTGTYRKYIDWNPTPDTMDLVAKAASIIEPNEEAGMIMTVRQLYYQCVIRNWLPNKQSQYDRLSKVISNARLAGLLSWTAFEDRNRGLKGLQHYSSLQDLLLRAKASYRIDAWANQEWRPEVWVEKAALEGVIADICYSLRIDFFAQRGYNSQTAQWEAGQRFASYIKKGQRPIVFHFGDHDPSGLDMTRDNADRLSLFVGVPVIVQRLALSKEQIEAGNYPPQPTKKSEGRAVAYVEEHGEGSWELDVMPSETIQSLIKTNVLRIRDQQRWDEAMEEETADKRRLEELLENVVPTGDKK